MFKKRNIIFRVLSALSIILFIIPAIGCSKEMTSYEKNVNILNNNFNVDIFVYGDDLEFLYDLEYSQIDTLTEVDSDADYTYLIINLQEGSDSLTEIQLNQLVGYMNGDDYKIIYILPSIYAESLYDFDTNLLGGLETDEINQLLLVDMEIMLNLNSSYSDNSTIVYLMIQDIKRYVEE